MKNIKCKLEISNKDEWLQYATKVLKERGINGDEETLREIFTFDFKFVAIPLDTITYESHLL